MTLAQRTMSLGDAREWLRHRVEDGDNCPCCGQFAKVYRRKIHATMARDLIVVYRSRPDQWFHLPTTLRTAGGDFSKLAHWGLIDEWPDAVRPDGSPRTGWYCLTPTGRDFARGRVRLPKYARIYNGRCLGLTGDLVGIRDALGFRFNYQQLMAGV